MEVFQTIRDRYSYRKEFLQTEIPEQDLHTIIEAGLQAPSGCNCQSTSFAVVTNRQLREEIGEILPTKGTRTAPALILLLTEKIITPTGQTFELEDYGAAAQNILLAISALGYATVWLDGMTKLEGRGEKIGKLLHIPEGKTVRAVLPVGVPAHPGRAGEKKIREDRVLFK